MAKQLTMRELVKEKWYRDAYAKPVSGRDNRDALRGFDWDRQNETRARTITPLSDEEIARELAARELADAEGIARRKPFIDKYLRFTEA